MKFPPTHHRKIVEIIDKHELPLDEFSFVKRKGWVHILRKEEFFAYFKKKETRLDPKTKKWIDSAYFKIKRSDKVSLDVADLGELTNAFDSWLKITA